ncbi:mannosyltransferase [Formosa algae]|uniref:mannosyltransferase n=1 Tax=Formosa algae TaxID=225843 RepID=UPI000CCEAE3B|nr:mannosyltransferase [Formosa algae]PNW27623.1 mannosyltransferase [Formosa algae]
MNTILSVKIKLTITVFLVIFIFSINYIFAYHLIRTEYVKLIILYLSLGALSYKLVKIGQLNSRQLIGVACISRLIFLVATPNLSQDFYRFIWDGRMIFQGYNPYLYTPDFFFAKGELPIPQAEILYNGMGPLSASHFTNYPPVSQFCYFMAAVFANSSILGSIIVMRLLIILADIGILHFGSKLLKQLNLPSERIFWYILNPFIIIELTGNLHFEGVMLFFLVLSLYLLQKLKWQWAAVAFSLSVATKLIPLIFLPFIFKYLKLKQGFLFCAIVGLINIALFLPFVSTEFITNYAETVGLWFKNFEFNASLFNIAKGIGFAITGHNKIKLIGPIMAMLVILYIAVTTYKAALKDMKNLLVNMLLLIALYYFMATTVHPWYVSLLLILSVFTGYKFPLVWSVTIIFSYLAYVSSDNKENLWIIALEYSIVYGVFIYEVLLKKQIGKSVSLQNEVGNSRLNDNTK